MFVCDFEVIFLSHYPRWDSQEQIVDNLGSVFLPKSFVFSIVCFCVDLPFWLCLGSAKAPFQQKRLVVQILKKTVFLRQTLCGDNKKNLLCVSPIASPIAS